MIAEKEGIGRARKLIRLPSDRGMRVELVLRPEPTSKMFAKVPLPTGFAVRGNREYLGALHPIRVRMAYAAWGGSKSYAEADFSLLDKSLAVSFSGVQEVDLGQLVTAPNVLRFTPVTNEFYVEVLGFDVNRALFADVRSLEDEPSGTENAE